MSILEVGLPILRLQFFPPRESNKWAFLKEKGFLKKTFEYEVTHPKWKNYEVLSSFIQIDFKENFGTDFEFLQNQKPHSILLAEGSEIEVKTKTKLNFN